MNSIDVPFHSLVLLSSEKCISMFPVHEYIDVNYFQHLVLGGRECNDDVLKTELRNIVEMKLRLGDRVVLIVKDQYEREAYAKYCSIHGISIFVGDGNYTPVRQPSILDKKFNGMTVIADIHGDINPLRASIQWALSRSNMICFLGDIIDYGKNPIDCMTVVYELVMRGKAIMLMGNHERKILKWVSNKKTKLSDSNMVTVNSLNKLSADDRQKWISRFQALCAHTKFFYEVSDFVLVHGATHPSFWTTHNIEQINSYALYGEFETTDGFRPKYNWINYIPKGKTVIVGHDTRSTVAPLIMSSIDGGRAVFLDTGCGKGGGLTTADLRFVDGTLQLANYNKH